MVVVNINNWHWVERNCEKYAQDYFTEKFTNKVVSNDTHDFTIKSVSVSGDCDVTQRKGQVRCLYDMILNLDVNAAPKKEQEQEQESAPVTSGTLVIKEFIHDEKEYEYEFKNFGDEKLLIKNVLVPLLLQDLYKFQDDLINDHTQHVQE
ncbi:hypothetical protein WICPIJ_000383 [Wickerhamomyces pijperi]|uniref:Activator of Hsp90 ATPase AHSA1-like N-terminal domain-containing protein n=1 Tax=Wickerhamomyces pijperi TaxID=599730 RepID=A0A9P8QDX0_WICPI|nr:hypothetical protein WICPIJ_000383 [Wickerhamomyces pijperi]